MKLEVAVHTYNTGSPESNLLLTQRPSNDLVGYLIKTGVKSKSLVATGFGESKPIAPNYLEIDRKLNRRIDFIMIN